MADLLIIIRDGLINSYAGSLASAMLAKQDGMDVEVLFVQEAIVALADKNFRMSPALEKYQGKVEDALTGFGLSGNPLEIVKAVKQAGVPMFTCPIWTEQMGVKEKIPEEIEIIDISELMGKIKSAQRIVGTF